MSLGAATVHLKSVLLKRRDDHAGVDSIGSSDPDFPGARGRVGPDFAATGSGVAAEPAEPATAAG